MSCTFWMLRRRNTKKSAMTVEVQKEKNDKSEPEENMKSLPKKGGKRV